MEYYKTVWQPDVTPLSAENLNKIENCLEDLVKELSELKNKLSELEAKLESLTETE